MSVGQLLSLKKNFVWLKLVSWSITSLFSTNKVRGGELSLPSEGRPAIY